MAAPMNFLPGGAEDDSDDDGFCFDSYSTEGITKKKLFDPIAGNNTTAPVGGRGGFGTPTPKPKQNAPVQKYKRSYEVREDQPEKRSLDMGDFQTAIVRGQLPTVLQYISDGFAVDTVLKVGWTGLMYAASNANSHIVKLLLENGANPNFQKDMYTVLMAACGTSGYTDKDVLDCVDLLLGKGAQVNAYDRYHMSPLMYAGREGRPLVIKKLAESGANVDKQDSRGWTSLTWAASKNQKEAVRALLAVKANPCMKHSDGQTVIDMVEAMADDVMLEILEGKKRDSYGGGASMSHDPVLTNSNQASNSTLDIIPESHSTTYGELELFLCGLDLSQCVSIFRNQQIDFSTFLRMSDEDLVKMGISQLGVRKKILDGIHAVHKKEWEKSSVTQLLYKKHISCAESLAMVANISKHTKYIGTSVGYLQDQIKLNPQIVEELQDGTGPKQLHQYTIDTLRNVEILQGQLEGLQYTLEKTMKQGNYDPPDNIKKPVFRINKKRVGLFVMTGVCLSVIVWKRQDIWTKWDTFWTPTNY